MNADAVETLGVGGTPQSYNLFAYCMNNPVNMSDPLGNLPKLSNIFKSVAIVAGTVAVAAACVAVAPVVVGGAVAVSTAACVAGAAATIATVSGTAAIVASKVESSPTIMNSYRDQSVYIMRDKVTNEVQYVGRTNNPIRRQNEHNNDPNKSHLAPLEVKYTGLTKMEARIVEQILISTYTLGYLDNARREIAAGKISGFSGKLNNILSLYGNVIEDELLNLMGR